MLDGGARIRPLKEKRTPKREFQPTPTSLRVSCFVKHCGYDQDSRRLCLRFFMAAVGDPALAELLFKTQHHAYTLSNTRMWANAQPDGRPAEYR